MGFKDEADKTRKYITDNLSFDKDISVQNFEITIRLLGGLLSSYQMTGDKKLLALADDLGNAPAAGFRIADRSAVPLCKPQNRQGQGRSVQSGRDGNSADRVRHTGKLTGKQIYYDKAKRALVETYKRRSPIGLVGTRINVETGKWTVTDSHISAEIDSYYEYLLKCWLLFDDKDCEEMWKDSIKAINEFLADEPRGELWYGHADMNTGRADKADVWRTRRVFPGRAGFVG